VPKRRSVRPRPQLLLLVYGVSVALIALTSVALVSVVSTDVRDSAIASAVSSDSTLVGSFVEGALLQGDLQPGGPTGARRAAVQSELASFIARVGVESVRVIDLKGNVLFSRGTVDVSTATDAEIAAVARGDAVPPAIVEADRSAATNGDAGATAPVLRQLLPITASGAPIAIFETERDASPILARIDSTSRDVVIVTLSAALILGTLLHLIFRAAQAKLTRQTAALLEATRRDAVTGLLNHGTTVTFLTDALESARAGGSIVTVALLDIDNFRLLNDSHGHGAGDEVLKDVARLLRRTIPADAIVGRYGPDEFLVVAPPASSHLVEPAVDQVRAHLADLSVQFGQSERLPVTVSAGLCSYPIHGTAATDLLSIATVTLGDAKASGGDAVRVANLAPDDLKRGERSSFDVLQGLVIAVDTKDRYTKRHSEDVARYAMFLAEQLGLDPETRRTLHIAGLLHDVGKIGIPDAILRKPASLTKEEQVIVQQHVALGDMIVRELPNVGLIRAGIRNHHERWDGKGYLDGLAGEEIPIVGRILAVADAFSAMTTTRPYRKALTVQEALKRLEDAADTQLDPRLAVAFIHGIETVADAPIPGAPRLTEVSWMPPARRVA
jgi:diguanylate cyclase (GGDEF)-like protein